MSKKKVVVPNKYTSLEGSGGGMSSSFKQDTLTPLGRLCFSVIKETVGNIGKSRGYSSKGMYVKWFNPSPDIRAAIKIARDKLLDEGIDVELIEHSSKDEEATIIKEENIVHTDDSDYYCLRSPGLRIQDNGELPPEDSQVVVYIRLHGVLFVWYKHLSDRLAWKDGVPYYKGIEYVTLKFKN
jgi:hypothetical protein